MNTDHLQEVLGRAAAPVPRPDLAESALERAAAVRRRRTAVVSVAAAVTLAASVAVGASLSGGPRPDGPVAPRPSLTDPEPTAGPTPPAVEESLVQPRWDPRDVVSLPSVDIGLPASLAPPAGAAPLTGMERALALVDDRQRLFLVDDTGRWARLDLPEPALDRFGTSAVVTVDGSRVVFTGRTALWTHAVSGGDWQRLNYPSGFTREADWGGAQVVPTGADTLWLGDPRRARAWYVDLATGAMEGHTVDLGTATWSDERGLIRILWSASRRFLAVGNPGADDESVWQSDSFHALTWPAADSRSLAAVRGVGGWSGSRDPTEQNGVIALRLDDLATRAYLPIRDPHYLYTDAGALATLSWLGPDTVLASVVPEGSGGFETGTRYLFTWNVATGELRRVAELPSRMGLSVAREGLG